MAKSLVSDEVENNIEDMESKALNLTHGLLRVGSNVAGASLAGLFGNLLYGPVGQAFGSGAGTLLGEIMRSAIDKFMERRLSPRQEDRTVTVIAAAVNLIQQRLDRGDLLRDDGFFSRNINNRSVPDEILEAVVLSAQTEHEEQKIPFVGNILGNIAFTSNVERSHANLLIVTAERMSYRQMCLLFVAMHAQKLRLVSNISLEDEERAGSAIVPLAREMQDLIAAGLLYFGAPYAPWYGAEGHEMRMTTLGRQLYDAMDLVSLRNRSEEWFPIAQLLRTEFQKADEAQAAFL